MEKKDFFTEALGMTFEEFESKSDNKSSGDYSKSASSGSYSKSASSGSYSTSASSGYSSKSASSGDSSTSASSGDYSKSASSGYSSKSASSGSYSTSASSGYYGKSNCNGKYSSATANGFFGAVMGATEGSVLMAVEFNEKIEPIGGAVGIVGKDLEPNKWYVAHEGELKELDETDGIKSIILQKKGNVKKVLNSWFKEMYIVTDGVNSAHGETIKEAREALKYKISKRDLSEFKSLTLESKLTFKEMLSCYRSITGACEAGIRDFCNSKGVKKKSYTIQEVIDITKDAYGNETFKNFFND